MDFNFNQARVKCPKRDFKVHVITTLLDMKAKGDRTPRELDVLQKAVDYIKALEREVVRLESSGDTTVVNDFSITGDASVIGHHIHPNEDSGRGFLGRLFLGNNS